MELRRWFRQTKAHNTMVLGKTADHEETGTENVNKAAGTLLLFEEKDEYQLIVTENQGYSNFKHRRSIFYVKQPKALTKKEDILKLNPKLAPMLPGLSTLFRHARVSPYYGQVYVRKQTEIRKNLASLLKLLQS